jgi:hypothetical protein
MLKKFLSENKNYSLMSNYCVVNDQFNTKLSLYNYYDQIFGPQKIKMDFNLFFVDKSGKEILSDMVEVQPEGFLTYDCRAKLKDFEGTIYVASKAHGDLKALGLNKFKIKNKISTGFYTAWIKNEKQIDIMHEWLALDEGASGMKTCNLVLPNYKKNVAWKIIVMNNVVGGGEDARAWPELSLHSPQGKVLAKIKAEFIPATGCQIYDLNKLLDLERHFANHEYLGFELKSKNIADCFSYETLPNGDFHIHHM